jgi:hypothetical protein
MSISNDPTPSNRLDLSGQDVTIGGDVAGRDKIVTTSTAAQTTIVTEGGPAARFAVAGLTLVAVLAVLVVAVLAVRGPAAAAVWTATRLAAATLTATPGMTATATASPSPTATATATPSTTASPKPSRTPRPTQTPSPVASPTAAQTQVVTLTPAPAAPLPLYDAFDDRCLDAGRWGLPALALTPVPGDCLPAEDFFFTEGRDGRLSVFLSLEAESGQTLEQAPAGCFREAAVTLALRSAELFAEARQVSLSVGLSVPRLGRAASLEVRLRAHNYNGRLQYEIAPRYSEPGGTLDFPPLPYTPGQVVTLAFQTREVGSVEGTAGVNQRLTVLVDGQPAAPALSVSGDPCALTLGYRADAQTLLDGYFEEVRLLPAP